MVSHWSLSDCKSSQVSWTLLSILADPNNAVVWMVSTRPLISKSYFPCTNLLVTVPRVPLTIGIIVTSLFHSLFSSLISSWYLSFFTLSFNFTLWSARRAKSMIRQVLLFCWLLQGLVIWPRLGDPFLSQNPDGFAWLILQDRFRVLHVPFVGMVKLQFLAQFFVDYLFHPVYFTS